MNKPGERKFLHDVASPIGTALFLIDCLIDELKEAATPPQTVEQAQATMDALMQAKYLIEQRRAVLIAEQGAGDSK